MKQIVFDIETGPLPKEIVLRGHVDPVAPVKTEFREEDVKLGNIKDEAKIAEKIEAARIKHEADFDAEVKAWELKKADAQAKLIERAALSATTGKVLAIGWTMDGKDAHYFEGDESAILESFWGLITNRGAIDCQAIGFNCNGFDVPFLVRRSWAVGVAVPATVLNIWQGRVSLNAAFVDLMAYWKLGNYSDSISLDNLAAHLGIPGKNGSGAHFADLLEFDRILALQYLRQDVLLTYQVAQKLGVITK